MGEASLEESTRGARARGIARRALDAEWGELLGAARARLAERRRDAPPFALRPLALRPSAVRLFMLRLFTVLPFTMAAVALVVVFDVAQHLPGGAAFAARIGVVQAVQPLGTALLRTPLSLFVPALDLPVWGALAQVLLVFGIAELVLGLRTTLVVGYACTLAGTFFTRFGVAHGPHRLYHLPGWFAQVRDTGPSAAVVGLVLCVAWRHRAWCTAIGVNVLMIGEAVALPNLAGLEHLAALACAASLSAVSGVLRRFFARLPAVTLPDAT
ncbi:hypothetical protein OG455_09640 [Kitasatospora sp. NBC_01287]|uniref:hypothetical protein n=1 Tax=Kitasatospora sp. NBC_01287 TaxID=2903573 RepID=UPI0022535A8C|nr:hypothetical protein [Kitasatospora sp. NBC_01287]MCX4745782.1 hypothetical protein [Kitasatospora sp. NBC_01287]